jgi:hypothetical protein
VSFLLKAHVFFLFGGFITVFHGGEAAYLSDIDDNKPYNHRIISYQQFAGFALGLT